MTALLRPRTADDLGPLSELLRQVHLRDGYPRNWPAAPMAWLSPPTLLDAWVAVDAAGRLRGHAALCGSGPDDAAPAEWSRRTGRPAREAVVLGRLFVDPDARGLGLGARLLDQVASAARARGGHLVLDVLATDEAAIALYERHGWRRLAAVEQQWGPGERVNVCCYAAPGEAAGR